MYYIKFEDAWTWTSICAMLTRVWPVLVLSVVCHRKCVAISYRWIVELYFFVQSGLDWIWEDNAWHGTHCVEFSDMPCAEVHVW